MAEPNKGSQSADITLEIPSLGLTVTSFTSYSFAQNFLSPSDAWSFTIGDDSIRGLLLDKVKPGLRVQLKIDGHVQSTGFVDSLTVTSDRSGGSEVCISGRDWLSPAVDACIDPYTTKFNAGQTLFDVISAALNPFGVSVLATDNDANKNVMTGQIRGEKTSKTGKPLKSFTIHQLRPYDREGAFQFAMRIADRFGLWIWPSADGTFAIVGRPSFGQTPRYSIFHKASAPASANNNVIHASVAFDATNQPSCIIAVADSSGGEFDRAKLKVIVVNELVSLDGGVYSPALVAILSKHKDGLIVPPRADFAKGVAFSSVQAKPQFLRDNESKTIEQLQHFAMREMALKQHQAVVARYTLEGHICNGQPWAIDTTVDIDDDFSNIHGKMWVMGRTFTKSRGGGTRTDVELVLENSIVL